MEDKEQRAIFIKSTPAREMLEEIAAFDALTTGTENMTTTMHRLCVEELRRLAERSEFRKWQKSRKESASTSAN